MKTFHNIGGGWGGKSAMVRYKIQWCGSHVVQQGHETISFGFAVKKVLASVWASIVIDLNTMSVEYL